MYSFEQPFSDDYILSSAYILIDPLLSNKSEFLFCVYTRQFTARIHYSMRLVNDGYTQTTYMALGMCETLGGRYIPFLRNSSTTYTIG